MVVLQASHCYPDQYFDSDDDSPEDGDEGKAASKLVLNYFDHVAIIDIFIVINEPILEDCVD